MSSGIRARHRRSHYAPVGQGVSSTTHDDNYNDDNRRRPNPFVFLSRRFTLIWPTTTKLVAVVIVVALFLSVMIGFLQIRTELRVRGLIDGISRRFVRGSSVTKPHAEDHLLRNQTKVSGVPAQAVPEKQSNNDKNKKLWMDTKTNQTPFRIFTQSSKDHDRPARALDMTTAANNSLDCHKPYLSLPLLLHDVDQDPWLPWIHDYFVTTTKTTGGTNNGNKVKSQIRFVAQNKRRCLTGRGKSEIMKQWEPQIALFQPISVSVSSQEDEHQFRQSYYLTAPETATYPETRFLCQFHDSDNNSNNTHVITTFSEYPFNYEYINWRKRNDKPMFIKDGPDVKIVDYSTLLFSCPIPPSFQTKNHRFYLNLIPIPSVVRGNNQGLLLTEKQVGPSEFSKLHRFNTTLHYGSAKGALLPPIANLGRLENLPICPPPKSEVSEGAAEATSSVEKNRDPTIAPKQHRLVACTWSAATYNRRGKGGSVADTPARLKEWLAFHQMVGYDHIYVYDNTQPETNNTDDPNHHFPLRDITNLFSNDFVTWIRWPARVCNNNPEGGRWPGERSSQYAAEASCRERFGPQTKWMSTLDTDEYMVPMRQEGNDDTTWKPLLDSFSKENKRVLGLRSARAKPRLQLLEPTTNAQICQTTSNGKDDSRSSSCLTLPTKKNGTHASSSPVLFLDLFNCDSVKPPKPPRCFSDMKQIYQPEFILSHFIHYSIVTRDIARLYQPDDPHWNRKPSMKEKGLTFLNEFSEGTLLHARSILPHETIHWQTACATDSKEKCPVGIPCPHSTTYKDSLLDKNKFIDQNTGNYCNCWPNRHIQEYWLPKLKYALAELDRDHVRDLTRK